MKRTTQLSILSFLIISCGGREFPEVVNVDSLAKTNFIGTLDEKVKPNQNQIYCSTLPFVWSEIRAGLKVKIETDSKSIKRLLEADDYKKSLQPNEITTTFGRRDLEITARAQFSKSLPFEFEFERNNADLKFDTTPVVSFGIYGYDEYDITNQIQLIYYKNDDEFALKLRPKNTEHEIYICLPGHGNVKTLKDVVKSIQKAEDSYDKRKSTNKLTWKDTFLKKGFALNARFRV